MPAAEPRSRKPTTGIAGCCARAASGQATAAPPTSVMKSRRFISPRSPRDGTSKVPCRLSFPSLTQRGSEVFGRNRQARVTKKPNRWNSGFGRLEPDVDVLLLGISQHFLKAFLAADAGLLEAAERRAEEMFRHLVDPDKTRLHRGGGAVRGGEVVGPDRSGETVFDGVDLFEHFGFVAPFEHREHGAENLLAGDAHIRLHIGEHGRLDEEALRQGWIGR